MAGLVPKLKKIKVDIDNLLLDPNNPRFITDDDQEEDESKIESLNNTTAKKMDGYDIGEIVNSIKANGWIPIDHIFVKSLDNNKYCVLEGNRRVSALKKIIQEHNADNKFDHLKSIEVMEVLNEPYDPVRFKEQITYLLGVRHHGSLKKWSPFARARNIYEEYLALSGQDDDTFEWNPRNPHVEEIAEALTIKPSEVKNRIAVYRVMNQIGNDPEIKNSESTDGGMKDRYYSLLDEAISKDGLKTYLKIDQKSMEFDKESLEKVKSLCNFEEENREGAVINKPEEWRKLADILSDADTDKRKENLRKVEEEHIRPSIVWAEREAELYKVEWGSWLKELYDVASNISLNQDFSSDEAKNVAFRLKELINKLEEMEG